MSILKFVNRTPKSIREMYSYLTDPKKTMPGLTFGIGVNPYNAAIEMELTQKIHHADDIQNPYVQLIFAFDEGTKMGPMLVCQICKQIGYSFQHDKRQIFGAIHYNKPNQIHCHYMINYIGINGNLWRQDKSVIAYKRGVNHILTQYNLKPIYYYGE